MKQEIIKLHEAVISDSMPEKFVDLYDGKGGFVYNFGAESFTEEVMGEATEEGEEPATETVTRYRHGSLVMEAPKTQNHILEVMLTEKFPVSYEQKLINDYNAAKEKILPSTAKDGYLAFLAEKKAIKDMVEADCAEAGIPNTL